MKQKSFNTGYISWILRNRVNKKFPKSAKPKKNASRSWRQVIEAGFIQARNLSSSIDLYSQFTYAGQVKSLIFIKIC